MSLRETTEHMKALLCELATDMEKIGQGNRAAAQRVRTGSIRFEKTAKKFRKESIAAEKTGVFKKAGKKAAPKAKKTVKARPVKKVVKKAAPKAKKKKTARR